LRMEELPTFLKTLRNYGGQENTKLDMRLLLLTGVRTGELRLATPDQFDLEQGVNRPSAARTRPIPNGFPA